MKPAKKYHKSGFTVSFMHFPSQLLLLLSLGWPVKRLYWLMIDFRTNPSHTSSDCVRSIPENSAVTAPDGGGKSDLLAVRL